MPKTKFQDIIFTLIMVVVMVYALVVYNIALDRGGLTNEVFVMAFGELAVMGIAGFLLEMFIAGPLAKKLAFRIVTPGEDRMTAVILAVSAMTVCIMCPLMKQFTFHSTHVFLPLLLNMYQGPLSPAEGKMLDA